MPGTAGQALSSRLIASNGSTLVRSYSLVVRGDSWCAICCYPHRLTSPESHLANPWRTGNESLWPCFPYLVFCVMDLQWRQSRSSK